MMASPGRRTWLKFLVLPFGFSTALTLYPSNVTLATFDRRGSLRVGGAPERQGMGETADQCHVPSCRRQVVSVEWACRVR